MPTQKGSSSKSNDKVRAHETRLRKQGLPPVQVRVPDVRSKAFAREAARQSRLIGESAHEAEDQAFVDAISEWSSR